MVAASVSGATVATAWLLGRSLVVVVEWSLRSLEEARRSAEAAKEHRAELVRALKQLDTAYYRLERANAALELAWKAAESAERAKSEFVTSISHDLRTPLNLIVGFSEMVLTAPESYGTPLPPAYRGDVHAIYRSAQHLLVLTNDVIDLARVGVGRLALAREPIDLEQVVADACAIVREYVTAKRLWLRTEIAPGLPTVSADRLRIRQVLLNLLTNAARFTEQGGIIVCASLEQGEVVVRVRDTGRGISVEELPRLFDEFFHDGCGGPDARADPGGVGLGLPISRRFVQLHGGRMGAESDPGAGTVFWFTLPIDAAEGAAWREGRPPVLLPGGSRPADRGLRIDMVPPASIASRQ
ncbi:MAG: hypothetical protein FJ033_07495 [Chloroflexi bacterium]|nr:hypothetical protein [Chloroflexota bacterium]